MNQLETIVKNLKNNSNVDSIFLTGSHATGQKTNYSDIDLVIVFNENKKSIKSLYTWIDDTFADVFFFDHLDLKRIEESKQLLANDMDAIFISWLGKATILFDKNRASFKIEIKP